MSIDGAETEERWVTLRDANAETGASVSALRKWYRNGTVRSEEREGPHGVQRYVWLADVKARQRAWAEAQAEMGRSVGPAPPVAAPDVDLEVAPEPPADSVMVPLEAWQRTLDTISQGFAAMHQAGQELAAAKEEAAVERTRAVFLSEQLGQAKGRADRLEEELATERARPRRRWWGAVR